MTNFEYIINRLTERDLAALLATNAFLNERELNKKVTSNSILAGNRIFRAWKNFRDSFSAVYHNGNVYDENAERFPNVFDFSRVCVKETDTWKDYGHGRMIAWQMWLESPYNPSHWDNE